MNVKGVTLTSDGIRALVDRDSAKHLRRQMFASRHETRRCICTYSSIANGRKKTKCQNEASRILRIEYVTQYIIVESRNIVQIVTA
jgi:hypothetical protein